MTTQTTLQHYEEGTNRALTYICQKAGKKLTLAELAEVACISKFHFLRMFKALVNETAGDFIRRIRIEKAAYALVDRPAVSVTQIALECGFSSSQTFAKAFKLFYTLTPQKFRALSKKKPLTRRGLSSNKSGGPEMDDSGVYRYHDLVAGKNVHLETGNTLALQVTVEQYDNLPVAYIRQAAIDPSEIIWTAGRELAQWAKPRKLVSGQTPLLIVHWDNLTATPMDKQHFDVSFPLEKGAGITPPLHKHTLVGGTYAVYHAAIKDDALHKHWNLFLKDWLPGSGFIPDDRPCIERIHHYFNGRAAHTKVADLCLPVKRL